MALWVLISGQQGMTKAVQGSLNLSTKDTVVTIQRHGPLSAQTPTESFSCITNRKPEILCLP